MIRCMLLSKTLPALPGDAEHTTEWKMLVVQTSGDDILIRVGARKPGPREDDELVLKLDHVRAVRLSRERAAWLADQLTSFAAERAQRPLSTWLESDGELELEAKADGVFIATRPKDGMPDVVAFAPSAVNWVRSALQGALTGTVAGIRRAEP